MPSLDISAGVAGSHAELRAYIGPALIGVGIVVILGVSMVMRHSFNQNPRDNDWTNPQQPGENVDAPIFLGPDGEHDKAGVDPAIRERRYHANLWSDPNSIIGRC
jgi:hypothetical protein